VDFPATSRTRSGSPLLAKYNCHINVEVCSTIRAVKYLYKYVCKGYDRASVAFDGAEEAVDEIQRHIDARYVSMSEAVWRVFVFDLHDQCPAVSRLQIHLEDHQLVRFGMNQDHRSMAVSGPPATSLTAFLEFNRANPDVRETYTSVIKRASWNQSRRRWELRRVRRNTIGRVYWVSPRQGELFYLRMLLHSVVAPQCWEDFRRYNDIVYPDYKLACQARGLLESDDEWKDALTEAASMQTGGQLRGLFVTLLVENCPISPHGLWMAFRDDLSDDCSHRLRTLGYSQPTPDDAYDLALSCLARLLESHALRLSDFALPSPIRTFDDLGLAPRVVREERDYDRAELERSHEICIGSLNDDQRVVYDRVVQSVVTGRPALYFLDGPGGTGKTFTENTILARLRKDGHVCLASASSGIAAILLQGGRTAHSQFKIPLSCDASTMLGISKQSSLAKLLQETELIIWDEAPMMHRHLFEALDRTLKDIRSDPRPFGGVTVLLSGDFRQVLPVIPKGTPAMVVDACLTNASFWPSVIRVSLTINMRLQRPGMSNSQQNDVAAYAAWLLQIRDGVTPKPKKVNIPSRYRVPSELGLINAIYADVATERSIDATATYFSVRAILAARNDEVSGLNGTVLDRIPGEERRYLSADKVLTANASTNDDLAVGPEYLNTLHPQGMPTHSLLLKVGAPIMLLRNLDPKEGLCNGSRLVVTRLGDKVLEARLITGSRAGTHTFIPRISLDSADSCGLPFTLRRLQFPIRLSFAMTINKSQGQSLQHVGILLKQPVFAHGQLYVALSRAETPANVKVYLGRGARSTDNVVYREVLNAAVGS